MSDLEEEIDYVDTDSSDNEEQHSKFLNSVAQLDSTQRVKQAQRKEICTEVSEYNLSKGASNRGQVNIKELARVLQKTPKHASISNKLKKVTEKSKKLPKPLEKTEEDKLKRIVGYENVKTQLKRWNAVVEKNSLKDHLTFPLTNNTMRLETSNKFFKQFQTATPLEEEISKLLKNKTVEKEDEVEDFPLTLEEMLQKRKEMARLRAQLSYKEAKAQRQNKIKSKKYHRILKHEKLRKQLKDFEILQKTDPTKALEKLAELDKNRALERASLRHRNTGQWAKNLTVRAKYDVESRKMLSEQLKMSREITKKVQMEVSSDDEEKLESNMKDPKFEADKSKSLIVSNDNPWSLDVAKEVQDFVTDYKKYWSTKNNAVNGEQLNSQSVKQTCDVVSLNEQDKATENSPSIELDQNGSDGNTENNEIKNNSSLDNEAIENNKDIRVSDSNKKRQSKPLKFKGNSSKSLVDSTPKESSLVTIRPTSGVWIVTSVSEKVETLVKSQENKKRKGENIDNLFNDLENDLMKKATKRVKKIKSNLKKSSDRPEKKLKAKKMKESKLSSSFRGEVNQRPDLDDGLLEGETEGNDISEGDITVDNPSGDQSAPPEIDPKNFIQINPKKLNGGMLEYGNAVDNAIDDEEEVKQEQQDIIEEAFGDDDVAAEFEEKKNAEGNNTELKISTALPGWGEWGGTGLEPSKRKRKRFTIIKLPPRKDKKKVDVIINEEENPNIRDHQVKSIPHPFKTVEAFESNIRAPIGREWIPETAHHRLIQKPIETKLGAIIEPMGEDEILKDLKRTHKFEAFKGKTQTP